MYHSISVTINGSEEHLDIPVNMTLLAMLREKVGLIGTKDGCQAGECGACTVLLDGEPVNSCMVLAAEVNGCEILTVEGLAQDGRLSQLQEAFSEHNAVQCGYCTSGMLISAYALLNRIPNPTEEQIKFAMVGNLCRCTGYGRIIEAIQTASKSRVK